MRVEMIQPIAMEEGLKFAIREGGRTVGSGRVTKILKLFPGRPRARGSRPGATCVDGHGSHALVITQYGDVRAGRFDGTTPVAELHDHERCDGFRVRAPHLAH